MIAHSLRTRKQHSKKPFAQHCCAAATALATLLRFIPVRLPPQGHARKLPPQGHACRGAPARSHLYPRSHPPGFTRRSHPQGRPIARKATALRHEGYVVYAHASMSDLTFSALFQLHETICWPGEGGVITCASEQIRSRCPISLSGLA